MTARLGRLRPRRPLRPLMLRTRFTLAAAGAVAAVTLAVTAVAFLVLRSDLQDQVQQQLRQQSDVVFRVARHYHGHIPAGWVPPLQVFVGFLRRKLEEGGGPRLLHNVRGVGYVIRTAP